MKGLTASIWLTPFKGQSLNRNLKIFERLDANRLVDYGVANMVSPGTFRIKIWRRSIVPALFFLCSRGVG